MSILGFYTVLFSGMSLYDVILACYCTLYFLVCHYTLYYRICMFVCCR